MCFEYGFEGGKGGGISDVVGECVPEVRGSHGEGPVTPGAVPGLVNLEEVAFAGPEGTGGDIGLEDFTEVRGCQVIECFVGC